MERCAHPTKNISKAAKTAHTILEASGDPQQKHAPPKGDSWLAAFGALRRGGVMLHYAFDCKVYFMRQNRQNFALFVNFSKLFSTEAAPSKPANIFGLISRLRKATHAPIYECRAALEKFNNNYNKAELHLNKSLEEQGKTFLDVAKDVQFKASNLFVKSSPKHGLLVMEMATQSDFVSRNMLFLSLGASLVNDLAYWSKLDSSKSYLQTTDATNLAEFAQIHETQIASTSMKLGEPLRIVDAFLVAPQTSKMGVYVHQEIPLDGVFEGVRCGTRISAISFSKLAAENVTEQARIENSIEVSSDLEDTFLFKLAQHVLAMSPTAVARSEEGELLHEYFVDQPFLFDQNIRIGDLLREKGLLSRLEFILEKTRFRKVSFIKNSAFLKTS